MEKYLRKIKVIVGTGLIIVSIIIVGLMSVAILDKYSVFSVKNIIVDLCLVGVSALVGALLLMSTFEEKIHKIKIMHLFVSVVMLSYILCLFITLLSDSSMLRHNIIFDEVETNEMEYEVGYEVNIIPFRTISDYITKGVNNEINLDIVVSNLVGNLIMFLPFSFLLVILIPKLGEWKKVTIITVVIVIVFECLQLILCAGAFDVDDIILNTLGSLTGFAIYKIPFIQFVLKKLYIIAKDGK